MSEHNKRSADDSMRDIAQLIVTHHRDLLREMVEAYRRYISLRFYKHHNGVIAHGPFAGQLLPEVIHWGHADLAAMILGVYEQEILTELTKAPPKRQSLLINIGAADGYYAIGLIRGGYFARAVCYEMEALGQETIRQAAARNSVKDQIEVRGKASVELWSTFDDTELCDATVLCDIEGGEYEVFNREVFKALRHCKIIIETHRWAETESRNTRSLAQESSSTHQTRLITMGARDLSSFPELSALDDTARWLMCSEGRPYRMEWLCLDPIIRA